MSTDDGALTAALAGLPDRLDRLFVTAQDGERFVLSTDSARNIVDIVREWLRMRLTTPAQMQGWNHNIDSMPTEGRFEALAAHAEVFRHLPNEVWVIIPKNGRMFVPYAWRPAPAPAHEKALTQEQDA